MHLFNTVASGVEVDTTSYRWIAGEYVSQGCVSGEGEIDILHIRISY